MAQVDSDITTSGLGQETPIEALIRAAFRVCDESMEIVINPGHSEVPTELLRQLKDQLIDTANWYESLPTIHASPDARPETLQALATAANLARKAIEDGRLL